MTKNLTLLLQSKHKLRDIWSYLLGNYRYKLYYSSNSFLSSMIRKHISQQITYRILNMNRECYTSGSCVKCGCQTTKLQMANKTCEGNCYPKMMNKRQWKKFLDNRKTESNLKYRNDV